MICKCGHNKGVHGISLNLGGYCNACFDDRDLPLIDVYHCYKADNLKYLELKYEEKVNGAN
jgi:hypothetical protein